MAEFITANWQMLVLAVVGVVVALGGAIVLLLWTELRKPTPRTGTPVTLPNGMRIQQWQKSETDFLYEEIWGRESAYSKEDKIVFEPGATIVDAGANIGMFSLYAAARCKGDAAIYAFEPIDTTYAVLRANAEAATNGAFEETFRPGPKASLKITAINKGLSDKPADVVFEHHPNFSVWSTQDAKFAVERLDRIAEDLPRATA
jgi:FkbM family methyltransferase